VLDQPLEVYLTPYFQAALSLPQLGPYVLFGKLQHIELGSELHQSWGMSW
jgi:hypothetical protein